MCEQAKQNTPDRAAQGFARNSSDPQVKLYQAGFFAGTEYTPDKQHELMLLGLDLSNAGAHIHINLSTQCYWIFNLQVDFLQEAVTRFQRWASNQESKEYTGFFSKTISYEQGR